MLFQGNSSHLERSIFSLGSFYTAVKINELGQSITLEPMSFESLSVVSSQETTVQRQTSNKLQAE